MTGFKSGASDDDPLGGERDDDSADDDSDSDTGDNNSSVHGDRSVDDGQSVGDSQVDDSALGGDSTTSGGAAGDLDLPPDGRQGTDDAADHEETDPELADADQPAGTDPDGAPGGVEVGDGVPTPTDGRLPWLFTRDSITDGRERTVQLHLQTATVDRQRRVRSVLEDRLDDRVSKADIREAALLVGLADPDGVAVVLEAWGYGAE